MSRESTSVRANGWYYIIRIIQTKTTQVNDITRLQFSGCSNVRLHPSSLPFYRNCTRITGGLRGVLKISEVSDQTDLSALSNLKSITGNLEVYNTELQNLSFFKNLQTINGQLFQEFSITSIHDNPKLTRLGLDSLTVRFGKYNFSKKFRNILCEFITNNIFQKIHYRHLFPWKKDFQSPLPIIIQIFACQPPNFNFSQKSDSTRNSSKPRSAVTWKGMMAKKCAIWRN